MRKYLDWVTNAEWAKEDTFFERHTPQLICCKYGQNTPIFNREDEAAYDEPSESDVRLTLGPFNFRHVETLTYAVATTYQ